MVPETRAAIARVLAAFARSRTDAEPCFRAWLNEYGALYGARFLDPGEREVRALRSQYDAPESAGFHELLFCAHTWFAFAVRSTLARHGLVDAAEESHFSWFRDDAGPLVHPPAGEGSRDVFQPLYLALVPRAVRHALGEYYTPEWLAELILDEAGYRGEPEMRLLDPACGSGIFLVLAIERSRGQLRRAGISEDEAAGRIVRSIHGFELNPLAALAARANYRLALGEGGRSIPARSIPVRRIDALLSPGEIEPFDLVVGNPPWVRWDYLTEKYRQATLPLWKKYGLFSLTGFQARLGGGKKDLSMLFTYACADRYLKPGGRLGFLITQEVFKSKSAGEGFRRFRLGEEGEPLGVLAAHDFTKLRPFEGAANKPAALVLAKGVPTSYPVPYFTWERAGGELKRSCLEARPLGSVVGPWITQPFGAAAQFPLCDNSPYRARLGANANPYGVFWLEVLESLPGGKLRVRNLTEMGKRPIPPVTQAIEADLVFPAVRGADLGRWRAATAIHVLIVQDPETRRGYAEDLLGSRWPLTVAWLAQFREELAARALFRKYHRQGGHPYYSQFNISRETFAPFKVVWQRMSNDLRAAVVGQWAGPAGRKAIVPLETTAFIATSSEEEAHYLCALMNSMTVREFVRSFSASGRGFGTPSVLEHIGPPPFDSAHAVHARLAELSRVLHGQQDGEAAATLGEIDSLVEGL